MGKCYLCGANAELIGQDYGLRRGIRCSGCGDYGIDNAAIPHILSSDFGPRRRAILKQTVALIHKLGKEAEIYLDSMALGARQARPS